jgi:hypothetical protein
MNHRILTLALCVLTAPAWTAAPKKPAVKPHKPEIQNSQLLSGRWQGIKKSYGRMGVEFTPTSATGGSSALFNGDHMYDRTPYRVEKDRLTFPERNLIYVFKVEKDTLWIGMPGEKPIKTYRRVKPAPGKAK